MSDSDDSPLAVFDSEIERTFRRRRRLAADKQSRETMGEPKSLRELWIPSDQSRIA